MREYYLYIFQLDRGLVRPYSQGIVRGMGDRASSWGQPYGIVAIPISFSFVLHPRWPRTPVSLRVFPPTNSGSRSPSLRQREPFNIEECRLPGSPPTSTGSMLAGNSERLQRKGRILSLQCRRRRQGTAPSVPNPSILREALVLCRDGGIGSTSETSRLYTSHIKQVRL